MFVDTRTQNTRILEPSSELEHAVSTVFETVENDARTLINCAAVTPTADVDNNLGIGWTLEGICAAQEDLFILTYFLQLLFYSRQTSLRRSLFLCSFMMSVYRGACGPDYECRTSCYIENLSHLTE